ncbi:MAG: large-conductance mechanosensitive channel protein MscL [Oscillospiraceae bacterium]|nr:large-conductance mechanosensitive channel protein MscL [Oscillospiraceae bacterium]MBR2807263.1 large-conductance mechanosensitive channel protein MscL [Oscillospiraceae bacterium]
MSDEKTGFFAEFKKFIMRGNVMDMAVGIVIGGAFTAIVNSLVNDIVMPVLGVIIGGVDFSSLGVALGSEENILAYGNFIQAIINFLAIALVVFCVVKAINKAREKAEKKKEEAPPAPPAKPDDVVLLEEIRDLLKKD